MNLAKLALAAERFTQSQPPITLAAMQCVHARDKSADCDRCVQVCPVGAIRLEGGIQIDAEACIRCGLCLHSCPTGAISGTDNVRRLLYCASQLVDHEAVEIACAMHPDPASGDSKMDAVLTLTGCLASLGASAYLSLAAQGVKRARVRLDACAACPLAPVQAEIDATIGRANDLLAALGKGQTVTAAEPVQRPKRRPVYSIKNPPVSRRGFFQALGQGARDFLPPLEGESERPRLINALRRLAPKNLDQPMPGSDFVALVAAETCNACATCARICPTGALEFARNDERFELTFAPAACVNCGLCLNYCEPQALQRRGAPTIGELIDPEPAVIRADRLNRCRKCNTLYAGKSDGGLCPVCTFRQKHPFGGRPALQNPADRCILTTPVQKDEITMAQLTDLLEQAMKLHHHLCPRQVLGVRMGMLAGELLGLELPQTDKRMITFVETDGCFADGVAVATGCTLGHRTLRLVDYGKVAATFVDSETEKAVRIYPHPESRQTAANWLPQAESHWSAMLEAYQQIPVEDLYCWYPVELTLDLKALISKHGPRVNCAICGEEILNEREVNVEGQSICRSCAGETYYHRRPELVEQPHGHN